MLQSFQETPCAREGKNSIDDRRLWIGNLDPRITEFQLLKIIQKYGSIEKFDLLFHKTGALAGQPRGYGFVTYSTKEAAEQMKDALHGKLLGSKPVSVRWAHSPDEAEPAEKKKKEVAAIAIPALGAKPEKKMSKSLQIKAIEAKLKMMEHTAEEDFQISNAPSLSSSSSQPARPIKKPFTYNRKTFTRHCPYKK